MSAKFPKIKICGVNDLQFARCAEDLGADYLGFIFAGRSPRKVTPTFAAEIAASMRGRARRVGVFTESTVREMIGIARISHLDVIQLHSADYSADEIHMLHMAGFEVWQLDGWGKAEWPTTGENVPGLIRPTHSLPAECRPDAAVLDGGDGLRAGGTGTLADWSKAKAMSSSGIRVVLAGGIAADNAIAAAQTGCAVLDVNSSLETSRAVKSTAALKRFFDAISPYRR